MRIPKVTFSFSWNHCWVKWVCYRYLALLHRFKPHSGFDHGALVFYLVFTCLVSQGGRNLLIHFVSCVGHPLQTDTTKSATPVEIKQLELASKKNSDTLDNSQLGILALAFL